MSNLLKQALKKGQPPKQEEMMEEEGEDEDYEEEEQKDQFQTKFPGMSGGGPIKPTQSFGMPPKQPQQKQQFQNKKVVDYSPLDWKDFYDERFYTKNGTPIFVAGTGGPIFFCLHGAGDSAQSFACLAREVKQFGSLVSFDFRGHGDSKFQEDPEDLAVDTLIKDAQEVLEFIAEKYPDPTFIIAGHSMGGSIAAKYCEFALTTNIGPRITGLIVIDVVEGTAMDALPYMGQIVSQRPQSFKKIEDVVQWGIKSNTVRNVSSAKISMPAKVREAEDENGQKCYEWKVDLLKSEKHWVSWFKGLTQSFLDVRVPKLLMTAEKERMDKDLTIAQMQGRFKLSVLFNTGHYMQEDDYYGTATQFHQFLQSFKIPNTVQDQENVKNIGVGKFAPTLKPYHPKKQ